MRVIFKSPNSPKLISRKTEIRIAGKYFNFHTTAIWERYPYYILLKNVWFRISNDLLFKIPSSTLHPKERKLKHIENARPTFLFCAYCATFFSLWPQSTCFPRKMTRTFLPILSVANYSKIYSNIIFIERQQLFFS